MFSTLKDSRNYSHAFLALFLLVFWGMSYFGKINPHPLGLIGGGLVTFAALALVLVAGRFGKSVFALFVAGLWLSFSFLVVSNWWHFQFFQSFYNYQSLQFASDSKESLNALSGFQYKTESLVLTTTTLFFAILSILTYRQSSYRHKKSTGVASVSFLGFVVALFVVNTSFQHYRQLYMLQLLPSYMHPVQAFFYSNDNESLLDSEKASWDYFKHLNELDAEAPSEGPLPKTNGKKYNVITIVLESVRASMVGYYGNKENLTPNFDRMAKRYIVADNFYANSNYTMKGETAIWCGIFDHNAKPPLSKYFEQLGDLNCLPEILVGMGYDAHYFHGNRGKFYSRDNFLPKVGFSDIYFHEDAVGGKPFLTDVIGWGVSDEKMYEVMLEKLTRPRSKPFYASLTTLSSHYPFSWDWGIAVPFPVYQNVDNDEKMYNNYKNAIYYEDYALGKFWEQFQKSSLRENTIVVVTADHGIWTFGSDKDDALVQNEKFFRLPLLIYHPDMHEPRRIPHVSSQIDLPVTILNLLGVTKYDKDFVGKNMFQQVEHPWAVMMKQGEVAVRIENSICYIKKEKCSGVHQNCVTESYGGIFVGADHRERTCVDVSGDLLTTTGAEDAPLSEHTGVELFSKAFELITYQNKKAFM